MNPNSHNNKFYANGGVVGQEIEFDFQGEDKKGVIKEITDMGDFIVITNDGRTVLAEERDIIKLGDMQKIAPEAPRKKRFGLFEAGGDLGGEPKEVKGYRVRIFSSDLGSNSNLLDGKTSAILVTDGKTGDSSTVMSNEPHLRLIKRQLFGKTFLSAEPVNYGHQGKHKMFGGTFVWSSDSRFRENISEAPIQLHDRVEFATGGSTESQYKIIEGFDHYKNRPLYQVSDMEDYEGEWHANYFDAQKELDDLNKNKFETGGNIEKENNEMLHSQAVEAKHHIEELDRIINSSTKVEPWVLSKMTRAKTDLSDITHYLEGENKASIRKPVYAEGGDVNQRGDYMLLGRLQADCDFYLGFGNRNERRLWAGNVKDQIAEMRSIYNRLKVKPEWITMKDINRYEKEMTTKMSTGGGVGSANSKIYKLRAEGLNDFLAFLQKGMYMRVKSFTVKPIGVPDVEVSFETDASLSEIKSKLREVPDSHVMIETVKPFNEYTGEREEDYAEGGILGSNFNPKSFTLEELNNHINDKDIYISYFQLGWSGITPASENKMIFTDTSSLGFKQWKNKKLTISDYGQIEVDRGSENIGLTVIVYEETSEKPYTIRLYSKDNHNGLKEVAKELITKMSRGGKLTKAQQAKIGKVMSEFKSGKLHSGSKRGPIVRKRKQALAIALAEANASRKMSTGGGVEMSDGHKANIKYLNSISETGKIIVLKNIANHYGISMKEAEEEVINEPAEYLYEYIANDPALRMEVYKSMKSIKMATGGWVLYNEDTEQLIKVYPTESEARKNLLEYQGNANIVEKSVWDQSGQMKNGGKVSKFKVGDLVSYSDGSNTFEGKITNDYTDEKFYVGDKYGYQVSGFGDRLRPEQLTLVKSTSVTKGMTGWKHKK
jgi:hypothetical protein